MIQMGEMVGEVVQRVHGESAIRGVVHTAGVLADAVEGDRIELVKEALWMHSHRNLEVRASTLERIMHRGNSVADRAADVAKKEAEAALGEDQLECAAKRCRQTASILKAIGSVWALWLPLPRGMERKAVPPGGSLRLSHEWHYDDSRR